MKKRIMFLTVAPLLTIYACNNTTNNTEKANTSAPITTVSKDTSFHTIDTTKLTKNDMFYQCPMDNEVMTDKPGHCAKCGMKLEQRTKK